MMLTCLRCGSGALARSTDRRGVKALTCCACGARQPVSRPGLTLRPDNPMGIDPCGCFGSRIDDTTPTG